MFLGPSALARAGRRPPRPVGQGWPSPGPHIRPPAGDVHYRRRQNRPRQTLPMATATIAPVSDGPFTQAHQRELAAAGEREKAVRKAARVASFNGWTTGIIAALSAPFALFSLVGLLVIRGIGRRRLQRIPRPQAAAWRSTLPRPRCWVGTSSACWR